MKERADEGALLDKLGVPPGKLDDRERWFFAHASPDKVLNYVNATNDADACSCCYRKKIEGYFASGRFVREQNLPKVRKRCDEWPGTMAVCAECGDELRLDVEMRRPSVLLPTKILLTLLAAALFLAISYAIAILFRLVFHHWEIVLSMGLASWFLLAALSNIWEPSSLSMTRGLYHKRLRQKEHRDRDPIN